MGFKIKKTVNGETVWEPIKAKKYTSSKITEYTGTLPITITANGESLIDYCIYGNTVQNETPIPENPVMPEGVGELETAGTHAGQYKLPILSNSTLTNIYLGEVETTRRIKKLVLTGEENWQFYTNPNESAWQFYTNGIISGLAASSIISNIAEYGVTANTRELYDYGGYTVTAGKGIAFQMRGAKDTLVDVAAWKAYLAQQYANGTPVTIWYVLANEETGIVNEPLMKIGNYTDTISMEQAGVSIPTNKGTTVIDYDGTTKPSQMYVKYNSWSGWSDINNYKMVNEDWTQEMT